MDGDTNRIVSAILHVSRKSGALATTDAEPSARAILAACADWEAGARGFVTPELKDTPPWAAYEMNILRLGRAIDLVIRKLGIWTGRGPVLDAAATVFAEVRYGRGRQSFMATVGEHGGGAYGAEVAALIDEEAMAGYANKALHRARNGEYFVQVSAACDRGRPWVQMAARAYLQEFGRPSARERAAARALP